MASAQTLEAGVIAITQLLGDVKKRVENLDNLIIPEVREFMRRSLNYALWYRTDYHENQTKVVHYPTNAGASEWFEQTSE